MAVVLITGTSSGIGLATALHFGLKGHDVYASLRSPEGSAKLTEAIGGRRLPITQVKIDVDDDDSVRRGVAEVLERAGRVDVLVNNAGWGVIGSLEEVSLDVAQRIFQTNYFGAVRMIREVLPGMRERRAGTIVNVSSLMGRVVLPTHGHYCASKHALEAASEALAQEVRAFNIRVAIVEPGLVLTPIWDKGAKRRRLTPHDPSSPYGDHRRRLSMYFQTQLRRPTSPEIVAEVIEHAVTTDEPRLRYLVGDDAKALVRGRERTSDEDWVDNGRRMTDAEYCDTMLKRCGVDLFR